MNLQHFFMQHILFWLRLAGIWSLPLSLVIFDQSQSTTNHLYDTLNFLHKWAESPLNRNHFRCHSKQLCLDPSFAFSSHPLPSWHHLHQTPSLRPFRVDVVLPQIQDVQGGVLFQCRGHSLAGDKPHDEHDDDSNSSESGICFTSRGDV